MNSRYKYLFGAFKLSLVTLGILCCLAATTYAATFTLVKTIDLNPLVENDGSIEVDVVGDELYVANWMQDLYYRINPITATILGSFSLGSSINIDNHGSEYNPTTGRIIHASDDDYGGSFGFDAFFETNTTGVVVNGPYDLLGPGDNSEDPEGLTVDPSTGRVWVSMESSGGGPDGIFEIDPNNGEFISHIPVGAAWALGFNPNSGKLFFADQNGVIKEVAPDGTGLATVFDPGVGVIFGMAFTPTGDLALLDFASGIYPPPSRLLLYDSSDDADNVFTTSIPILQVPIDIKPGSCPNPINVKSKGVLPVAVVGNNSFDVTQVDPASVLLEGVAPLRWAYADTTSPFEPFLGKQDCHADCDALCPDGSLDLVLNFNRQEIIAALGDVADGECVTLSLTGNLKDEFGGTPIVGEDVILILKKGKK